MKEKEQNELNEDTGPLNNEKLSGQEPDLMENAGQPSGEENIREEDEDTGSKPLERALQEQKEKYLRLVAEFDNFRKRNSRERLELIQTANKDVILSLLEILDDMDRAAKQMEQADDIEALKQGIFLIFNKLRTKLQSLGLKEMDSLHADFDAELHDAITEIPAPSDKLKGKVVDDVQKGYYLNDKLIRHAKVVVGK